MCSATRSAGEGWRDHACPKPPPCTVPPSPPPFPQPSASRWGNAPLSWPSLCPLSAFSRPLPLTSPLPPLPHPRCTDCENTPEDGLGRRAASAPSAAPAAAATVSGLGNDDDGDDDLLGGCGLASLASAAQLASGCFEDSGALLTPRMLALVAPYRRSDDLGAAAAMQQQEGRGRGGDEVGLPPDFWAAMAGLTNNGSSSRPPLAPAGTAAVLPMLHRRAAAAPASSKRSAAEASRGEWDAAAGERASSGSLSGGGGGFHEEQRPLGWGLPPPAKRSASTSALGLALPSEEAMGSFEVCVVILAYA